MFIVIDKKYVYLVHTTSRNLAEISYVPLFIFFKKIINMSDHWKSPF